MSVAQVEDERVLESEVSESRGNVIEESKSMLVSKQKQFQVDPEVLQAATFEF